MYVQQMYVEFSRCMLYVDCNMNNHCLNYKRGTLTLVLLLQVRVVKISCIGIFKVTHVIPFFYFIIRMYNLSFFIMAKINVHCTNRNIFQVPQMLYEDLDYSFSGFNVLCSICMSLNKIKPYGRSCIHVVRFTHVLSIRFLMCYNYCIYFLLDVSTSLCDTGN